jgi:hypothetical protein
MTIDYWKKFKSGTGDEPQWMTVSIYSRKLISQLVDKCARQINVLANTDEDVITEEGREIVLEMAYQYFDYYHYINGCIIDAMLTQEG